MDSSATINGNSNPPSKMTVDQLPPEALALATRLFTAARQGQLDIFQAAFSHSSSTQTPTANIANLTNPSGNTLLMLASYHGHTPLVRLLLQHGADPNRLNDRGQSPLAGVVFKNERECVEVLLAGGADPELGEPSAIEACRVFGMAELEGVMAERVRERDKMGDRGGEVEGGGSR
jgi:hypothetical protein